MGDLFPSWLVSRGRLPRACRVSIVSCRSFVPSCVVGFGGSWCVLASYALRMFRRPWIFALAVAALILFLFFWLIPNLSRFVSMAFSFMVLEPTIKLSWSDVHPGFLAFLRMFIKFSYCLDTILSFLSR